MKTTNPSHSPGQQTRPSEELALKIVDAFLANFATTQKDMGDWIEQYTVNTHARLIAERDGLAQELQAERNMHGQTRVVVEELNTICNDLRNAGQPQFVRSEAIRLLREDQAELRSVRAALVRRVEGLEEALNTARETAGAIHRRTYEDGQDMHIRSEARDIIELVDQSLASPAPGIGEEGK